MASFADSGLDARLLRALAKKGYTTPTPVQAEAIPKVLEGKDVVARARTGSGKTAAYLLPALHKVLAGGAGRAGWQALVLVPTRELAEQVREEAASVAQHCGEGLRVTALAGSGPAAAQRSAVSTAGQVVVATPGRVAQALRDGSLSAHVLSSRLHTLVLDEADLLLSYGYEEDLRMLAPQVPRSCQCLLMSATSSGDIEALTQLVLHNPVTLDLTALAGTCGGSGVASSISHFRVECEESDRLLHTLALLKLGLVRKKVLLFVGNSETGLRLRLFLEAFGLRPVLLNAELPLNSRHHILQGFNRGLYDYLIATDDAQPSVGVNGKERGGGNPAGGVGGGGEEAAPALKLKTPRGIKRKRAAPEQDGEFGVTRGIDFKGVRTVINYDVPPSIATYVHRVGRTGRAGAAGTAITLLCPKKHARLAAELNEHLAPPDGVAPREGEEGGEPGSGAGLCLFDRLTRAAVESLRYRAEDIARSITRPVIKEARAKDLRQELLNSDRLAAHFEAHPVERQLLAHDRPLRAAPAPAHLKHLPAYLRDPTLATGKSSSGVRGKGVLSAKKRRKLSVGMDPVKGFVRAPKRGGHVGEQLTDMEKRAAEVAKKAAKKAAKTSGSKFVPKRNVRRNASRKR